MQNVCTHVHTTYHNYDDQHVVLFISIPAKLYAYIFGIYRERVNIDRKLCKNYVKGLKIVTFLGYHHQGQNDISIFTKSKRRYVHNIYKYM